MAARKGTPLLEWFAAATGALVTLALLGFIAWKAVTATPADPATVTLRAGAVHATPGGYVVEVTAHNPTDSTAAAVRIEGRLGAGDETSEATIDYVPGRSERKAALLFSQDPRRHGLSLRATGYEKP